MLDDDASMRELIRLLLDRAGLESCEAASAEEALAIALREKPSVAIVDVHLGQGKSGYEVFHELRDRAPELPIVVISGERTESYDKVAGFLLGADDYIVKPFDPDELIARVRRLAERSGAAVRSGAARSADAPDRPDLTPRELEVLGLLAGGLSQPEIAAELGVSSRTVATHIRNLLGKLEVHSRAQAVARAYQLGLVEAGFGRQPVGSARPR